VYSSHHPNFSNQYQVEAEEKRLAEKKTRRGLK
jgi:hypothetical protein